MFPKIPIAPTQDNIKDLVLGLIVSTFFWPICIILYTINVSLRFLAQTVYDHFYPGEYVICDGEDGVFGTKVKGNCNSLIQGYQVIRGTPDISRIRSQFSKMLTSTGDDYSRFKYIFTDKFGYYCWKKADSFNVDKHIRIVDSREVDERKMLDTIGDLVSQGMTAEKPQWEILLYPNYRLDDQKSSDPCDHYVILTRFNHAYSDAISYFLMVNFHLADAPAQLPMDPTKELKVPVWAKAFIWAKVLVLGPLNFCCIMASYMFDVSVFRASYYSDTKLVARSPGISLETVKNVKKASGASVTAILFTAVYSALYKAHLKLYPEDKVPKHLHLGNVMAMFPYWTKRKLGNQFTLWPYTAPLEVEGGLEERLEVTNELTQKGVRSPDPVFDFYMTRSLGCLPKVLHNVLWSLSGSPIMLSNVPGFSSKLKLYGGEMVDGAGFIPLMSTTGVGLSTQTYCGELRFNAVVDPKVFPRRSDLQYFVNEIISELRELAHIFNVPQEDYESEARALGAFVESPTPLKGSIDLMVNPKGSIFPINLKVTPGGSIVPQPDEEGFEKEFESSTTQRFRGISDKEGEGISEAIKLKQAAEDFKSRRKYLVKSLL